MALNSSVQSAAMGVAAFVGGLIISRDAQGLLQHFWVNALLGVVASVLSVLLVGRLKLHGATPPSAALPASPVAPAKVV
jgi:predicted MFS family arabinose efflux permease